MVTLVSGENVWGVFKSFLESQRGGVSRPETFTKRCVRKRVKNVGFGKLQKTPAEENVKKTLQGNVYNTCYVLRVPFLQGNNLPWKPHELLHRGASASHGETLAAGAKRGPENVKNVSKRNENVGLRTGLQH